MSLVAGFEQAKSSVSLFIRSAKYSTLLKSELFIGMCNSKYEERNIEMTDYVYETIYLIKGNKHSGGILRYATKERIGEAVTEMMRKPGVRDVTVVPVKYHNAEGN